MGFVDAIEAVVEFFGAETVLAVLNETVKHFVDLHSLELLGGFLTRAPLLAHGHHHLIVVVVLGYFFLGLFRAVGVSDLLLIRNASSHLLLNWVGCEMIKPYFVGE